MERAKRKTDQNSHNTFWESNYSMKKCVDVRDKVNNMQNFQSPRRQMRSSDKSNHLDRGKD